MAVQLLLEWLIILLGRALLYPADPSDRQPSGDAYETGCAQDPMPDRTPTAVWGVGKSTMAGMRGCAPPCRWRIKDKKRPAQCRLARLIASERAPTNMRLKAQVASRLNQLRDTNLRPRYR